jgi:uncharacterized membrane protein YbjE (DUF340 family)
MVALSIGEFSLVYSTLSFALAAMMGSFVFFVLAREQVDQKYRPALLMIYTTARARARRIAQHRTRS